MIDVLYDWLNANVIDLDGTPLRLLHFATFRMVLAFLTAFLVTFLISPHAIAMLYRRGMRDRVRAYDKLFSQSKSGTPTMGGLIIIGGLLTATALWCNPLARKFASGQVFQSPVPLLVMTVLFYGGIGAIDDVLKVKRGGSDGGLSRKLKLLLQAAFAILFGLIMLADGTSIFPPEMRTQDRKSVV